MADARRVEVLMTESAADLESARRALHEAGIEVSVETRPGGGPHTLPFLRFGLPETFQVLEVPPAMADRAIGVIDGLGIDRRAARRKNVRAFLLTLVSIAVLSGVGFVLLGLLGLA